MYQWPHSKTFAFSLYGRPACHELAREYCRRAQFFFDLWVDAEVEVFHYEQVHLDMYEETLEWVTFCCELDEESETFARAIEIRSLLPKLGAPDLA